MAHQHRLVIFNFIRSRSYLSPTSASRATGEAAGSSSIPPPPPPPSSIVPQDMQIDSLSASSESLGDNNNIFISTSELRAEWNTLMEEIQSSLQYLRSGGSMRREDMMILDFLVMLSLLIDSEVGIDELIMDFQTQMGSVEIGLTEQEILRCINEETYRFSTDVTSTLNQTCTICQEDFVDGESIGRLDCMHIYHLGCIKPWLELRNACPICKQTALKIDEDVNESEDGN